LHELEHVTKCCSPLVTGEFLVKQPVRIRAIAVVLQLMYLARTEHRRMNRRIPGANGYRIKLNALNYLPAVLFACMRTIPPARGSSDMR
jgi:hypothetical protein